MTTPRELGAEELKMSCVTNEVGSTGAADAANGAIETTSFEHVQSSKNISVGVFFLNAAPFLYTTCL